MKLLVANWKMNPGTPKEAEKLLREVVRARPPKGVSVAICLPYPYLALAKKIVSAKKNPSIGVQNIFWQGPVGAYTGEVSGEMARAMGARYVILGHSERRLNLHETDEMVAKKTAAALKAGLTAVVCVGEPLAVREEGEKMAEAYVIRQLEAILTEVPNPDTKKLIIAYEPFWAISTAKDRRICSSEIAANMMNAIRALLQRRTARREWNILYGGSVSVGNAVEFLGLGEGALIGGVSLKIAEFAAILKLFS